MHDQPRWAQTRDPLPADAPDTCTPETCTVCRAGEFRYENGQLHNFTRSTTPGGDGRYTVQVHEDWCPVLTGEQPEVACPTCGAPVYDYEYRPGYVITRPGIDPFGRPGSQTVVGTLDEIGQERTLDSTTRPEPAFSKLGVQPCGHVVEGDDATRLLALIEQARRAQLDRQAAETIAARADLLAAAEAAGMSALADRYRQAVRADSHEQSGLLAALTVVAGREGLQTS